jgi:hypothetical protein
MKKKDKKNKPLTGFIFMTKDEIEKAKKQKYKRYKFFCAEGNLLTRKQLKKRKKSKFSGGLI